MESNISEIGLNEGFDKTAASTTAHPIDSTKSFGNMHLEAHARWLGTDLQIVVPSPKSVKSFRRQFEDNVAQIEMTHRSALSASLDSDELIQPIAEWFIDNFHVIHEQIQDIREHLPAGFFHQLPKLITGAPRVHRLARELISHSDSALDEELIVRFVDQFQSATALTIGETWAFPIMLRLVLVEELSQLGTRFLEDRRAQREARLIAEKLLASPPKNSTIGNVSLHRKSEIERWLGIQFSSVVLRLHEIVSESRLTAAEQLQDLEQVIQQRGWNLAELRLQERHQLAATEVSIGNVITSMRLIKALDWIDFFELTNRTERVLRADPARVYAKSDFLTRNRYRDAIEQVSRRSEFTETEIAQAAIDLARNAGGRMDKHSAGDSLVAECKQIQNHVGYWLVDRGRQKLEQTAGCRSTLGCIFATWIQNHPHSLYFGLVAGTGSLFIFGLLLLLWQITQSLPLIILLSLLAFVPISEMSLELVNAIVTRLVRVRLLSKLEFRDGASPEFPTFVVIPSMLSSADTVNSLLQRLENHYLANTDRMFLFGLLTDFADAPEQITTNDGALLQQAREGIHRLNERYRESGRPFYLFHRERRWNEAEQKWMGWERKRGKLQEFNHLLIGKSDTSFVVREGDLEQLQNFQNPERNPLVITLDADTILPRDAARRLVGTLAHPLNRPMLVTDKHGRRRVERGYAILQPRISIHLSDSPRTRYLKSQTYHPGMNPYVLAASDVYQDLFAEGSFTGKGIYDVRAFEAMLHETFPENQILSHDLIEGCHARVGLVSDIEVFDGYPSRYDADAKRIHRWVRGDWQISAWLFPRVPNAKGNIWNSLSMLSRWKILDNLRRSLWAPMLLAFLLVGWTLFPQRAGMWSLLAGLATIFPWLIKVFAAPWGWNLKRELGAQVRSTCKELLFAGEQILYSTMLLPHTAWLMLDAISRTLFRVYVSRQRLLEWETAAATESRLQIQHWSIIRQTSICSVLAVATLLFIDAGARWAAAPWLTVWFVAPLVAQAISTSPRLAHRFLDSSDRDWLREVASGTWAFFEEFVNEQNNWLPPDNVQEYPRERVAMRISPTNEGMFLVSGLAAQQMGMIGLCKLVSVWQKNLASWNSLEQLQGHHFNWYETSTLQPLRPHYVSTVDSGNLAGSYLALVDGIRQMIRKPIFCGEHRESAVAALRCLVGRTKLAMELLGTLANRPQRDVERRERLAKILSQLEDSVRLMGTLSYKSFSELTDYLTKFEITASELERCAALSLEMSREEFARLSRHFSVVARRFRGIVQDARLLMPWLEQAVAAEAQKDARAWSQLRDCLTPTFSLQELQLLPDLLAQHCQRAASPSIITALDWRKVCRDVGLSPDLILKGSEAARELIESMQEIGRGCEQAVHKMDFRFLYNPRRKLFSIGFNADIGMLDRGHYDLLCSECRLASYLAIAKGDVATEHWFQLGRQAIEINGQFALVSWGGTMFEYLMPQLFQRSFVGSLIDTSCHTAILEQIEYGQQRNVPWGVSESAYSALAKNSDYHYKSFGLPSLGFKRGLASELVISPYSTALALPFSPRVATANLRRLAELALGQWGFYDAIDYTPARLRYRQAHNVVRNYMAHHQGMTLLAIANALHEDVVVRWFHAHPLVRANELLLQEKEPSFAPSELPNSGEVQYAATARPETPMFSRQIVGTHSTTPRVILLSNGDFHSMMTNTGGSFARTNQFQVTRWRSDPTCDRWGTFIYLRDRLTGEFWSATYQPTRVVPDHYETLFAIDKAEIHRRQGDLETTLELVVSPEHNAEVRQLRITNHGRVRREIEVTSYAEVVLATAAADLNHPAFQKLFVEMEFISENATLMARRRPRSGDEQPLYALHTLVPPANVEKIEFESSRETFLGRGRTTESPTAMLSERLSGTTGAVLDPVFSLRCTVTIEPTESVVLGFTTATATSRDMAIALADVFHELRGVQRAYELAWAFAQLELRYQKLSPRQFHLFQQLGGLLLYPHDSMRGETGLNSSSQLGQNALWQFGISGDLPILLLRIDDADQIQLVQEVVAAHRFLISRGLTVDLVIINDYSGTYFDHLQEQLRGIAFEDQTIEQTGKHVFILKGTHLIAEEHRLLDGIATVFLSAKRGSLAQQIEVGLAAERSLTQSSGPASKQEHPALARLSPSKTKPNFLVTKLAPGPLKKPDSIDQSRENFPNGFGYFADDGRKYHIQLSDSVRTPAPWSNVMANPNFGCLLTESGGGNTWFGNSRENKLTVWSNDPTSDPASEIVYFHDAARNELWSPIAPLDNGGERSVSHGQGFSSFTTRRNDLECMTRVSVHPELPLKIVRLAISNRSETKRSLRVTYYAETVLGPAREETMLHQVSSYDSAMQTVLMTNNYHPEFKSQVVFLKLMGTPTHSWTGDQRSFVGRDCSLFRPVGAREDLNLQTGAGRTPCLAMQGRVTLEANESKEIYFLFGAVAEVSELPGLLAQLHDLSALRTASEAAEKYWNELLDSLSVQTPNHAMDVMVNRWLPYQILSCRLWGRSAFYQSGGAYGFRDQLQDVMALVYLRPDLTRD